MKFYAEHTKEVIQRVTIEIEAESREQAEEINEDWCISDGGTESVKVLENDTSNSGDYAQSDVFDTLKALENRG